MLPAEPAPDRPAWLTPRRCPRCDARLWTNGEFLWCSRTSGLAKLGCPYGVGPRVPADDPPRAPQRRGGPFPAE